MMKRSFKLLNYSLNQTLVATILTAAAPLAATFVDGVLAGHLIGDSAFNAINIILPVSNLVMVLTLICNMGGSVMAAKAIGNGNSLLGSKIFTISHFAAVLLACASAAFLFFRIDAVSAHLCPDAVDMPYVKDYLSVLLIYFLILPTCTTLNNFVSVEGYPGLTTVIVITANVVNILLDIVFIVFMNMGIKGAALATVVSGIVNAIMYLPHFAAGKSQYKIVSVHKNDLKLLKNIIVQGIGFNIFYLMSNIFILLTTRLIFKHFGTDGILVYGICLQIQSFTFCVTVGNCIAGISHITALQSEGDNDSIRFVMNKLISLTAAFYFLLVAFITFFPRLTAGLFGIDNLLIVTEYQIAFACFGTYYICFAIIAVYSTVCLQLMGHILAKALYVFGLGIFTYLTMLGISFIDNEWLCLGFPIGGITVLILTFLFGYRKYLKDRNLTRLLLISRMPSDVCVHETLDKDGTNIAQILEHLQTFSDICGITEQCRSNIELCCNELCDGIRERNLPVFASKYDLTFRQKDDKFLMTVKFAGAPFCLKIDEDTISAYRNHPTDLTEEEMRQLLLNVIPESTSYRYMFGMNVTVLTWTI